MPDEDLDDRPPTHSRRRHRPDRQSPVDEMIDASFPASDPPAVWTWDVAAPDRPPGPLGDQEARRRRPGAYE